MWKGNYYYQRYVGTPLCVQGQYYNISIFKDKCLAVIAVR